MNDRTWKRSSMCIEKRPIWFDFAVYIDLLSVSVFIRRDWTKCFKFLSSAVLFKLKSVKLFGGGSSTKHWANMFYSDVLLTLNSFHPLKHPFRTSKNKKNLISTWSSVFVLGHVGIRLLTKPLSNDEIHIALIITWPIITWYQLKLKILMLDRRI